MALGGVAYGAITYGGSGFGGGAAALPPGLIVCINGADFSPLLKSNSLSITDNLNNRNRCSFVLIDESNTKRLKIGSVVIVLLDSIRIFAGTIETMGESILNPGNATNLNKTLSISVNTVDFNQLADRHIVARDFENFLAGDIVKEVITNELSGEGVTDTFVQDSLLVTKAVFNHQKAAEVFDELSERTGTHWYIDYFKQMHFEARNTTLAPFSFTDADAPLRRITVSRKRDRFRNRQFIRGGQDTSDAQVQTFAGDGETQVFPVSLPIAVKPTIRLDTGGGFVAQSIGIRQVDDPAGFQWFFQRSSNEISQRSTDTAISSTDVLEVTFQGFFPIIVQAQNEVEQVNRQLIEGGTGIYEELEVDERIDDRSMAVDRAGGILRRFGDIPETISFETDKPGLRAGQLITITLTDENITGQFLIDSVRLSDVRFQIQRFRVRALSGEHLGGWQQFFKKLLTLGNKLVIRDNEVILVLREFPNVLVLDATGTGATVFGDKNDDFWTDMQVSDLVMEEEEVTWNTGIANMAKLDD